MAPRRPTHRRPKPFRPADLLKQVMIQGLAISPDGAWAVYTRRTIEKGKYRSRLWRVSMDGGRPEQLTTADALDGRPRFSPDGSAVLFLSDRSERSQPWILPISGGEPRQLADLKGNVGAADWSPDGSRVLLVAQSGAQRFVVGKADDPVARRITDLRWRYDAMGYRDQFVSAWTVSAAGGRPLRITEPTYDVTQAFWSPDGTEVGLLADRRPDPGQHEQPQAWAVPAVGGRPRPLARTPGSIAAASWSPGGRLALLGIEREDDASWANLVPFVATGRSVRRLAPDLDTVATTTSFGDLIDPDAAVATPLWLGEEAIVVLVSERGAALPYRFGLDGTAEPLAEGDIVCTAVAEGGGRIAVVATDRGRPGEVSAVEDGRLRPLTSHGSRWLSPYRRDPERFAVRHTDGHDIDTWLVRAAGPRRPRPTVVQIHGGPHASHGPTPWLEMLALADAGFHVLYANPRGSASYGEGFCGSIHGAWGEADSSDVLRVVDWAVAEGLADPRRVGVMGLSYGGYLTNWLLGHHPGRFAAAVSENPVTDWVGMFGESDIGTVIQGPFVGLGSLPEHLDEALKRSPWVEIYRNEAPLLLLQSEDDLRCPPGQSELVFAMLKNRGRDVELVRYPGESHYLVAQGRPDRRVDRMERIVGWFGRHLGRAPRRA